MKKRKDGICIEKPQKERVYTDDDPRQYARLQQDIYTKRKRTQREPSFVFLSSYTASLEANIRSAIVDDLHADVIKQLVVIYTLYIPVDMCIVSIRPLQRKSFCNAILIIYIKPNL